MRTYTTISACRACGHNQLDDCFSLGNQWVSDFPDKAHLDSGTRCPIDIVSCPRCTLVQARHTAPQELLYSRHYWYKSGTTETMRVALHDIAMESVARVKTKAGDAVLDIGSNDGTLLRWFKMRYPELVTVGVEPADNLQEAGGVLVNVLIHDFWPTPHLAGMPKAKIITALGMFYDLDNPNPFIKGVAEALAPDGVFCAQLMCLRQMLDASDVGNLCHEHLEFYTLRSLDILYRKYGLTIIEVEQNKVNGGSYRIWARLTSSLDSICDVQPSVGDAMQAEESIVQQLPLFWQDINRRKHRLLDLLTTLRTQGKRIAVYGASTKGNVLLQFWGLSQREIVYAAERDPAKYGRYTVGSRIPIVPEDEARKMADVFLVLPYAFRDEIIEREREWLANGGRLIFPMPNVEMV